MKNNKDQHNQVHFKCQRTTSQDVFLFDPFHCFSLQLEHCGEVTFGKVIRLIKVREWAFFSVIRLGLTIFNQTMRLNLS